MPRQRKDTPPEVRTKDDQVYLNAERDFVYNGLDLEDIAKKYNVKIGNVRMWHYSYRWRDLRLKQNSILNEKLFEVTARRACDIVETSFDCVKEVVSAVHDGFIYLRSLKEEEDEKPIVLLQLKAYQELTRLGNSATTMYNQIKPEISSEVADKILQSIEALKVQISKEEKKV